MFKILKYALLFFYIALLIIHFFIKDRFQWISVLFYGCPLPLIIIFGCFVTLSFWKRKRLFYILSTVLLAISIYFGAHYYGTEFEKDPSKTSSHILFWNAAESQPLPTEILIKHINESNAQIIALVEALSVSKEDMNILKKAFPYYQFELLQGDMLIAVKGSIDTIILAPENDYCKYNYIKATIQDKQLSIIIADVQADPLLNKEIPLDMIRKACEKYDVDILVGDFNTPYESVFFKKFKDKYNSFHPYSIGMSSTWPTPVPVIELDQIWIKKPLQPIKLNKFYYKQSDHHLLIGEYQ